MIRTLLVCVGALGVITTASAWNATGHMLIAKIALNDLKPNTLSECNRLLQIGTTEKVNDFVTAGPWADDIRSRRPETGVRHYINLHFRLDGLPVTSKPEDDNVVKAINDCTAILKDKSWPDAERADALRFLIHYVGDIHQPLHTVALDSEDHPKGDRGGNDFPIKTPIGWDPSVRVPTNLHSLWDSGLGLFPDLERPLTLNDRRLLTLQADTLSAVLPRSAFSKVSDQNPVDWAVEGLRLAEGPVYRLAPDTSPDEAYMRSGRYVATRQVVLAGYRLADLLNRTLP